MGFDWLLGWLLLLVGGALLWMVSLRRRDVSIVDIAWGPAFALLAWVWAWRSTPEGGWSHPAVAALLLTVTLWAVRLALHVAWRSRGRGEDRRYRAMRDAVGPGFARRSLVTVFALQATLAALLAAPFLFLVAAPGDRELGALQWTGLLVWTLGFLCEAIADWQLQRFAARPDAAHRVLADGLWRYSRHPNYFGEATLWWGWALLAHGTGAWPWALLAALAMTVLLLRVSGVPLVERGAEQRRPGYADYVRRTSGFVLWPPKRTAEERR